MQPRERESTFGLGDGDGCRSRIPYTMSVDQSTQKKKKTLRDRNDVGGGGWFC